MGTGTKIVLVLCLIVFCGSGYYLADYYLKAHQAQSAFSELAEDNDDRDLAALYQKNNDLVGWVEVEGTKIDYPVMQTKDEGEDPEFYLHRDFDKEYSDSGTPFMDVSSDISVMGQMMAQDGLTGGNEFARAGSKPARPASSESAASEAFSADAAPAAEEPSSEAAPAGGSFTSSYSSWGGSAAAAAPAEEAEEKI